MNVKIGQLCAALGALSLVITACQQAQQQQQQPQPQHVIEQEAPNPQEMQAVVESSFFGQQQVKVEATTDSAGMQTPPVVEPSNTEEKKEARQEDEKKEDKAEDKKKDTPKYKPVEVGPYVPHAPGKRVACVSVPGPYVALTFDDGPSPANTPRILDILKKHNAHATFFVAGENAVGHKGILARAVAEGHEIGTHTYTHINLCRSSDEKIDREMSRTNAIITEATGRAPRIMRPPYGATNARLVDKMYDDYGMASILWDVDTNDWRHPGVSVVINRAVNNARPGSIILVHDIHTSTANAVEGIVTGLQARGFILVTVSELLDIAKRGANQGGGDDGEAPSAPQESAEPHEVTGAADISA